MHRSRAATGTRLRGCTTVVHKRPCAPSTVNLPRRQDKNNPDLPPRLHDLLGLSNNHIVRGFIIIIVIIGYVDLAPQEH